MKNILLLLVLLLTSCSRNTDETRQERYDVARETAIANQVISVHDVRGHRVFMISQGHNEDFNGNRIGTIHIEQECDKCNDR